MQERTIQYSTIQYSTIQYSTIQYSTITHITQNNIQYPRKPSIRKITTTKIKFTCYTLLYTIKTHKRVEPKVDESVLKTTKYTKQ